MALLDPAHLRRRGLDPHYLHRARDVRADDPRPPRPKAPRLHRRQLPRHRAGPGPAAHVGAPAHFSGPPFPAALPGAHRLSHLAVHERSLRPLVHVLRGLSNHLPKGQGVLGRQDGVDVHPRGGGRAVLCALLAARQQALPDACEAAQRPSAGRGASDPHDGFVLVHTRRPVHLCVVVVSAVVLGRAGHGRIPSRLWLHFPVQLGQQLPGGFVSAPGCLGAGGQDVHQEFLGRWRGAVHGADVRSAGRSVGLVAARLHQLGLLCYSVPVLEIWC